MPSQADAFAFLLPTTRPCEVAAWMLRFPHPDGFEQLIATYATAARAKPACSKLRLSSRTLLLRSSAVSPVGCRRVLCGPVGCHLVACPMELSCCFAFSKPGTTRARGSVIIRWSAFGRSASPQSRDLTRRVRWKTAPASDRLVATTAPRNTTLKSAMLADARVPLG